MAQRTEWRFSYPAGDIAEKAKGQAEYHLERAKYWEDEFEAVKNKLQEQGVTEVKVYDITGGQRAELEIKDPSLAKRMSEAQSKWQSHRNQVTEYERWTALLRLSPDLKLTLDYADATYFGLAWSESERETNAD